MKKFNKILAILISLVLAGSLGAVAASGLEWKPYPNRVAGELVTTPGNGISYHSTSIAGFKSSEKEFDCYPGAKPGYTTLSGKAVDEYLEQPIKNCKVIINVNGPNNQQQYTVYTNDNGNFKMDYAPTKCTNNGAENFFKCCTYKTFKATAYIPEQVHHFALNDNQGYSQSDKPDKEVKFKTRLRPKDAV